MRNVQYNAMNVTDEISSCMYNTMPWMLRMRSHLVSDGGHIRCIIQTPFLMCNTSYNTSIWCKMRSCPNIHDFLTYISHYHFLFHLKMAFITKTCCWWSITKKDVYRLYLYLFYLLASYTLLHKSCQSSLKHITRLLWRIHKLYFSFS